MLATEIAVDQIPTPSTPISPMRIAAAGRMRTIIDSTHIISVLARAWTAVTA